MFLHQHYENAFKIVTIAKSDLLVIKKTIWIKKGENVE